MHRAIRDAVIDGVRRRVAEGDCPVEPAASVEMLENVIVDLVTPAGECAAVIGRLINCIAAQRAIIDGPQYGTVETEAARLSYAAMLDARRLLAASPASLSGGAEEPWHTDLGGLLEAQRVMRQAYKAIETAKAQNTHIPGNPYDVALSSLNPALASLDTLIISHPSPEAPANRQGLVARLLGHADYDEDMSDALREGLREAAAALSPANRQEAGEVERLREAARHALTFIENRFSDLSPEKRATAEHLRLALTSPKDVKGAEHG